MNLLQLKWILFILILKKNCKKIILGCTEIPIAIFAYKSFKKVKESKIFIDPNLLLAEVSMRRYK